MGVMLDATGTQNLATALGTAVTADGLFGAIVPFIPFVGAIVLFSFGYHILRKAVRGASKGKARI